MHRGYAYYNDLSGRISAVSGSMPSFLTAYERQQVAKRFASIQGLIKAQIAEMDRLGYRHKPM